MQDLQTQVNKLAQFHPPLSRETVERRMPRLKRMQAFYEEKAPGAPEGQKAMFYDFVSALEYAMDTMKHYDDLTQRLAALRKGNDGTETTASNSGV